MNKPVIPKDLPGEARDILEKISRYEIIGASLCIRAITKSLAVVAAECDATSPDEVMAKLTEVQAFFCHLKPNTAAYLNVTQWVLEPFRAARLSLAEFRDAVVGRVDEYNNWSQQNMTRIAEKGASLLPDGARVLTHDYSSTIMAVLAQAKAAGKTLEVMVTEGRPVDQAERILRETARLGHRLALVPDAAIGREMPNVTAVLLGVECLFGNGDLLNTVGTLPISLVAREYHVPVYAPTEIVKIHQNIPSGQLVPIEAEVLRPWFPPEVIEGIGEVKVDNRVLDLTPGRFISAYVTEQGIVSPSLVPMLIREFYAQLQAELGR